MFRFASSPKLLLFTALVLGSEPALAQSADQNAAPSSVWGLPLYSLGSAADDRVRVAEILGRDSAPGYLIRSPSTLTPGLRDPSDSFRWAVVAPEVLSVWNTDLPVSRNEGALWAGRGLSAQVRAGVMLRTNRISLILAPEFTHSRNRDFHRIVNTTPHLSSYASRLYQGAESADLPVRLGGEPLTGIGLGQSTLAVSMGRASLGASTENQWWGPGLRNAIVMSNNAPGFPHLFARTARPLRTRFGSFAGKWLVGGLTESLHFDSDPSNDLRSISALAATFQPAGEPNLSLGIARAVYRPASGAAAIPVRPFDVLRHWSPPDASDVAAGAGPAEQLTSLFGRWVFPADGVEVFAEWARLENPDSFRDFLAAPNHSQGYTVGLQWAHAFRGESTFRIQSELTYLEESATYRQIPVRSFYTSPTVVQGYTHRGRVLGAAIGPGSSSQWLAADYLARAWQIGVFGGRVRWNNIAHYRARPAFRALEHDVSIGGGVRAAYQSPWGRVEAEFGRENRMNYQFRSRNTNTAERSGFDVPNTNLRLVLTPGAISWPSLHR
jgi:hypothetical protein